MKDDGEELISQLALLVLLLLLGVVLMEIFGPALMEVVK
jgi:hypothetical protein